MLIFCNLDVIVLKMESLDEIPKPNYLSAIKRFPRRLYVEASVLTGTILAASTVGNNALSVRANDSVPEQIERVFTSELVAPNMGDVDKAAGIASQIVLTTAALGFVQETTEPLDIVKIAGAAQFLSSGADTIVERTGWLTHAELAQKDDGSSAIYLAWFTKSALDRLEASENHRRAWQVAIGTVATLFLVAVPLAEGTKGGGKLIFVSHAVGIATGYGAHRHEARKRKQSEIPIKDARQ